jgi:DNA-binding NarL/FixJ family response regulator
MPRYVEPTKVKASPPPIGGRSLGVAAIDPIPIFRDGLSSIIHRTHGFHWIGHAGSHHSALQLVEQLKPDVLIVDSALDPSCHLTRLLTTGDPALLVVTLVRDAAKNPQYLAAVVAAGAHAVVPRSTDARRLAEAIRRAYTDRRYLDPALAALTARPKRQAAPAADGSPPAPKVPMPLSRREYQVLQLVAEGLENSGIAKILFLSVETVRTHVKSILRKLSARDRTHAVTIAFRGGILVTVVDDTEMSAAPPSTRAPAATIAPGPPPIG